MCIALYYEMKGQRKEGRDEVGKEECMTGIKWRNGGRERKEQKMGQWNEDEWTEAGQKKECNIYRRILNNT